MKFKAAFQAEITGARIYTHDGGWKELQRDGSGEVRDGDEVRLSFSGDTFRVIAKPPRRWWEFWKRRAD
jgi:hypothetical protein